MKFLADENVSRLVVVELQRRRIDAVWIKTLSPGASDERVIQTALESERIILTSDKGFGERVVRRGVRVAVILLRLSDVPPTELASLVGDVLESRTDWSEFFSVVDRTRIRMIPLPP